MAYVRYIQQETPYEVTLDMDDITVGRSDDCVLQIHGDREISRLHCAIQRRDAESFVILDSSSRNGTYVNDSRLLAEAHVLTDGDHIKIGNTVLTFHDDDKATRTEAVDVFTEIAEEMNAGKGFNTMMHEIIDGEKLKTRH
ncbi:MAG: FHA domain-containing protein [Lentisphaeria bacterium]|nr:FHA domain-containing protein [Lentisphaeria bacterium]